MNQWPNGANGHAMFSQGPQSHPDPASMYSHLGGTHQVDFSQFTAGVANGSSTPYSTPAFHPPPPTVPAKRSHDHESRSHTPSYGGYQNQQAAGQQFPNAPTAYSHLQQSGSNNASPSPIMQNQQYRPPTQQRMQNHSPAPFQQSHQGNHGGAMSPGVPQSSHPPTSVPQQNSTLGYNPQNASESMQNMRSAMASQMASMNGMQNNAQEAQRAYQMRLLQQQQQLRNSGLMGPRPQTGQQNPALNNMQPHQMTGMSANGQTGNQANLNIEHHKKRRSFLNTLANHAAQQGRPFNHEPTVGGRAVDLWALWQITISAGGSTNVDRAGQWQMIADKMGLSQPQFPNAPQELKNIHITSIGQYERLWFAMRDTQKQNAARVHAQQMAGVSNHPQGSPTRAPSSLQHQYSQLAQTHQAPLQPQATPNAANIHLPQNGMATPQPQSLHARRSSSMRKTEHTPPQIDGQALAAGSPQSAGKVIQRSPPVKEERIVKSEEPQSTTYVPNDRSIDWDGGYQVGALDQLATAIASAMPRAPTYDEMGVIDIKAISLSLASGIQGEVRYALDALASIAVDQMVPFELDKCEDLLDILVDCAEDQVEQLSEEAVEVSDALDLPSYEDIARASRVEAETLQDVPELGTREYELNRAADKLIAVMTILRNFSFYEHNHALLTSPVLVKWLSHTIRLLGTRNMLLRTWFNTQDFYKDVVVFLSNITQSLELPSRDDALHILHFLLAFAPQPAPSSVDSAGRITFTSFIPSVHCYLPPAVDCLAKLLARQDPNRTVYKSIFTTSTSSAVASDLPLDLLTKAFALSISVLPDRGKGAHDQHDLRVIVSARKAFIRQGMLAADILTSLAPANDTVLARAWLESEDGWAVGLLNLTPALYESPAAAPPTKSREPGWDLESFKLITDRALAMIRRLIEMAGKDSPLTALTNGAHKHSAKENNVNGDAQDDPPKWEVLPQSDEVLGALTAPYIDKTTLGLLCNLHEMGLPI